MGKQILVMGMIKMFRNWRKDDFYMPKRNNGDFTRKDFKVGQKLKILYNAPVDPAHPKRQQRHVKGRIVFLTNFIIVIQCKNYKEDFKFSDFTSRLAVIVG